jgi:glyoxylase-like metal-dependent hydrolase (beta-lactamase superfamily II)
MKQWIKPRDNYTEITLHDNIVLSTAKSRPFLAALGIGGEIVHTPGHSDDSVTLVLDTGVAFTGDLTLETMVASEDAEVVARSWQSLRERGVTTIYGGHAGPRPMPPPP